MYAPITLRALHVTAAYVYTKPLQIIKERKSLSVRDMHCPNLNVFRTSSSTFLFFKTLTPTQLIVWKVSSSRRTRLVTRNRGHLVGRLFCSTICGVHHNDGRESDFVAYLWIHPEVSRDPLTLAIWPFLPQDLHKCSLNFARNSQPEKFEWRARYRFPTFERRIIKIAACCSDNMTHAHRLIVSFEHADDMNKTSY